jgi:hypothetical protein
VGRRVEHHVVEARAPAREEARELVEGGDLGGARARELLLHGVALGRRGAGLELREYPRAIGLRCVGRIDVEHREPWRAGHGDGLVREGHAEHLVEVRRGVGAHEEHPLARIGEGERGGRRDGGLTDPAFAREEEEGRRAPENA